MEYTKVSGHAGLISVLTLALSNNMQAGSGVQFFGVYDGTTKWCINYDPVVWPPFIMLLDITAEIAIATAPAEGWKDVGSAGVPFSCRVSCLHECIAAIERYYGESAAGLTDIGISQCGAGSAQEYFAGLPYYQPDIDAGEA